MSHPTELMLQSLYKAENAAEQGCLFFEQLWRRVSESLAMGMSVESYLETHPTSRI